MLGFIVRNFDRKIADIFLALCNWMVRPNIDYAVKFKSCSDNNDIDLPEGERGSAISSDENEDSCMRSGSVPPCRRGGKGRT